VEDWSEVDVFGSPFESDAWIVRPSAYGLIVDEHGRLAVVRTPEGLFLPGGGIEPGETPQQAVIREVLEECGLSVRIGEWGIRAVQFVYSVPEKAHFEKKCTFIDGTIDGQPSAPLEPDHELVWFEPGTAEEVLSHQSHRWAAGQWVRR
jgi:8-oxo-dGTP diphosphatase